MLSQEDKINVELIKKIVANKKTTLPSLKNQDWNKSHWNWKDKQIINKYPSGNITELSKLI